MREETARLLSELETRVSPDAKVSDIAVSDMQMVEIAKALSRNARVLIMDEPTAVLTNREAAVLFRQIEKLKERGTAILYTSFISPASAPATRRPSRRTVMRSAIRATSSSLCEV